MIKFVLILIFIIFQINLLCAEQKIDYIELDVMDKQHIIEKIFEYIEIFYNRKRIHSSNNYMSPSEFEDKMLQREIAI